MTEPERGPIEWVAVEFPCDRIPAEVAAQVEDLVERGVVRLLDIVILRRDDDGTLDTFEVSDLDESDVGVLRAYRAELVAVLDEAEVAEIAAAVTPGSAAAILVWEDSWATPFGTAVRRSGGQVVSGGRVAGRERSARRR